jgi:hypothetical protein
MPLIARLGLKRQANYFGHAAPFHCFSGTYGKGGASYNVSVVTNGKDRTYGCDNVRVGVGLSGPPRSIEVGACFPSDCVFFFGTPCIHAGGHGPGGVGDLPGSRGTYAPANLPPPPSSPHYMVPSSAPYKWPHFVYLIIHPHSRSSRTC